MKETPPRSQRRRVYFFAPTNRWGIERSPFKLRPSASHTGLEASRERLQDRPNTVSLQIHVSRFAVRLCVSPSTYGNNLYSSEVDCTSTDTHERWGSHGNNALLVWRYIRGSSVGGLRVVQQGWRCFLTTASCTANNETYRRLEVCCCSKAWLLHLPLTTNISCIHYWKRRFKRLFCFLQNYKLWRNTSAPCGSWISVSGLRETTSFTRDSFDNLSNRVMHNLTPPHNLIHLVPINRRDC